MQLSEALKEHARLLLDSNLGSSQEVNLRRAVSAAYYAVFHLLSAEVARQMSPEYPKGLRGRTQRALGHPEMAKAAGHFLHAGELAKDHGIPGDVGPLAPVSMNLARVAGSFRDLQQARYIADYDVLDKGKVVNYVWASEYVAKAEQLFLDWKDVQGTDNAKVFLAALMLAGKWAK
jgi:hypothetical protein